MFLDTLSTVDTTDKKCLTKVDDNTPDLAVFSNFQSNTVDFCVQFCYSKQLPYALLSNGLVYDLNLFIIKSDF